MATAKKSSAAQAKKNMTTTAPKKTAAKKTAPKTAPPAQKTQGVPTGLHTLTANLIYEDAAAAIPWYGKAFGATELSRMSSPNSPAIWHAEIKIGDSVLYLSDASPMGSTVAPHGPKTSTVSMQIFVPDADALFQRAVDAGAKVLMPIGDMFWGDRMGVIEDPFGHCWMISTRIKDMTPDEQRTAAETFVKAMMAAAGQGESAS
ncbi:MAG: VOC family protein [Minicystis sp.]